MDLDKSWHNYDFFDNDKLRIMPTAYWQEVGYQTTRTMLHFKAQYFLPTTEAISELQKLIAPIGPEDCLEIGAGNGWLGSLLGIKMTDSHRQSKAAIMAAYLASGQPIIVYGQDVEKLDALSAVRKYKPHTVIGSWVSEKSSILPDGIDEEHLLRMVKRYILIGSDTIHGKKIIMARKHQKIKSPFLLSRTEKQQENSIWIWE
jgi:hypothetical protein